MDTNEVEKLFREDGQRIMDAQARRLSQEPEWFPDLPRLTEAELAEADRELRAHNCWYRRFGRWLKNLRVVDIHDYRHKDTL